MGPRKGRICPSLQVGVEILILGSEFLINLSSEPPDRGRDGRRHSFYPRAPLSLTSLVAVQIIPDANP